MGIEDRDWYRHDTKTTRSQDGGSSGIAIVAAIVIGLIVAGVAKRQLQAPPATYGAERKTHSLGTVVSMVPGLPGIRIGGDSLYAKDDPWKTYLADEQTCPGSERSDASLTEQAATMVCLVNYARNRRGLQPLTPIELLDGTSALKAERIVRCRDFNHDACGTDPAGDARAAGYLSPWGENLYIAGGPLGSPRLALDGWLNSDGHRRNLFRPEWRTQGVAVRKLDTFGRESDMTLWINQFGEI
ncbi:MAG: CAP domain-containing protein [Gaiellaceae bacterium MAG52_C11]|nr:CAP domain-containing protein [Candidatus Gaiellasilicea maunaloa]